MTRAPSDSAPAATPGNATRSAGPEQGDHDSRLHDTVIPAIGASGILRHFTTTPGAAPRERSPRS